MVGQEDVVVEEGDVVALRCGDGAIAGVGDAVRGVGFEERDGHLVLPPGDDRLDGVAAVADDDDLEVA